MAAFKATLTPIIHFIIMNIITIIIMIILYLLTVICNLAACTYSVKNSYSFDNQRFYTLSHSHTDSSNYFPSKFHMSEVIQKLYLIG